MQAPLNTHHRKKEKKVQCVFNYEVVEVRLDKSSKLHGNRLDHCRLMPSWLPSLVNSMTVLL